MRVSRYVLFGFHGDIFSHTIAGLTYCAVGALSFLGRLSNDTQSARLLSPGTEEFESLVRWLVSRQTSVLGEEEESDLEENNSPEIQEVQEGVQQLGLDGKIATLPDIKPPTEESLHWAGFNGRCNKIADTCYSFWDTATLAVRVIDCHQIYKLT